MFVVMGAVLLGLACGAALQLVRSPAQAALDTAAPARSVLTAPVERTVVKATTTGRATVTPAHPTTVAAPAPTSGGLAVVSARPVAAGGTIRAGDVVIGVSGRPVIALPGAIPAYRDLEPGDVGDDVRQFQSALVAAGFPITVDGDFGEQTKVGIRWLYRRAGYAVPSTTGLGEPPSDDVTSAQTAARQAQRHVTDLAGQLATAKGAAADQLRQDLADARDDATSASAALARVSAKEGPILPRAEVVFVQALPARLVTAQALGAVAKSQVATLSAGGLTVRAGFAGAAQKAVATGMVAQLEDEASGWTGSGTVTSVGAASSSDAEGDVTAVIAPDHPLPSKLSGVDLKVTVTQVSSGGKVLAVPIAAITATADGSTYVVVSAASGDQRKVMVTTGVNGGGTVEVEPVNAGALEVGDQVVTSQ
jgi:peptidoglycan hydrolase-like protein with peptidoglycan-binding domain